MFQSIDNIWKSFISPEKQNYTIYDLGYNNKIHNLLGIPVFDSGIYKIHRHDFTVPNKQNHQLRVSFFEVQNIKSKNYICYLHCYNGCRIESLGLMKIITSMGINFCTFDFQASGQSQGEYVTFGALEKFDVQCVLDQIDIRFGAELCILWGRSMGATTALLYPKDSRVIGLVLDSPFHNLRKLTIKMIQQKISLPKIVLKGLLSLVQDKIERTAHFQFSDVAVSEVMNNKCEAIFIGSHIDSVVPFKYTKFAYDAYQNEKTLHIITSDHAENRDPQLLVEIIEWAKVLYEKFDQKDNYKVFSHKNSVPIFEPKLRNETKQNKKLIFSSLDQSMEDSWEQLRMFHSVNGILPLQPLAQDSMRMSTGYKIKNRIISSSPQKYNQESTGQKVTEPLVNNQERQDRFTKISSRYANPVTNSAQKYKQKIEKEQLAIDKKIQYYYQQ